MLIPISRDNYNPFCTIVLFITLFSWLIFFL